MLQELGIAQSPAPKPRAAQPLKQAEHVSCNVSRRGPLVVVGVEGNGFLWNMVRIMAGTLIDVGLGRTEPQRINEMLAARDRRAAGLTAPPHGLYLQWIKTA